MHVHEIHEPYRFMQRLRKTQPFFTQNTAKISQKSTNADNCQSNGNISKFVFGGTKKQVDFVRKVKDILSADPVDMKIFLLLFFFLFTIGCTPKQSTPDQKSSRKSSKVISPLEDLENENFVKQMHSANSPSSSYNPPSKPTSLFSDLEEKIKASNSHLHGDYSKGSSKAPQVSSERPGIIYFSRSLKTLISPL